MGRRACCEKVGLKKGPWSAEEDNKLINFILTNAQCCWRAVPKQAGLLRCGKSCRLRWTNYLRPDLKRGLLSEYEENILIDLHAKLGNKWSKIASQLPGRTDNEIKNHWNTYIKKKLKKMGIDPATHKPLSTAVEPPPQEPPKNQQQQQVVNEKKEMMMMASSTSLFELDTLANGFCIDEVPLIQPHEIQIQLPPTTHHPTSTTSSSSSSSSSSGMHQVFENFDWQLIEDYISLNSLWDDDDDLINLDHSYLSSIDNNNDISGYCHYPGMV